MRALEVRFESMKVKYVTARPYKGKGSDPSFTFGRTYLVLGVRFKGATELTEIIVRRDSDAAPVLAELRHFSVVDPAVPPEWGLFSLADGSYALEPKEFSGEFWNRYHDGEPEAENVFERIWGDVQDFHCISP